MRSVILLALIVTTIVLLSSCQKEIDWVVDRPSGTTAVAGNSTTPTSTFPYYFIGTVNGSSLKYEADDLTSPFGCGISEPGSSSGTTDYDVYEGTVIAKMSDLEAKNAVLVHILKYFNHEPSMAEKLAMFKVGSYPYGVSATSSATKNGASITFLDANGNNWFSETGSQTGSTFNITEYTDNPGVLGGKLFKATFSCKLYNEAGSSSIQVTNAVIKGKLFVQ
jgi:hypothetical protein